MTIGAGEVGKTNGKTFGKRDLDHISHYCVSPAMIEACTCFRRSWDVIEWFQWVGRCWRCCTISKAWGMISRVEVADCVSRTAASERHIGHAGCGHRALELFALVFHFNEKDTFELMQYELIEIEDSTGNMRCHFESFRIRPLSARSFILPDQARSVSDPCKIPVRSR